MIGALAPYKTTKDQYLCSIFPHWQTKAAGFSAAFEELDIALPLSLSFVLVLEGRGRRMEAVAKHDFTATAEDELSFRRSQILKVRTTRQNVMAFLRID